VADVDVKIVIVNYNAREHLLKCLESIHGGMGGLSHEVYVVDNLSGDGSAEAVAARYPGVVLERNAENVGFARGNNQVMKREGGAKYFLLLNPDIIVGPGSVGRMVAYMEERESAGVVGCRLLNPDGSLQYSCRRWPEPQTIVARGLMLERFRPGAERFGRYFMRDWDHGGVAAVDWLLGSCMLLRARALEEVGYFDERFFMYYEDVDLCLRMRRAGWGVYYVPDVTMVHHHIQASHKWSSLRIRLLHVKSAAYFFHKHGLLWRGLVRGGVGLPSSFEVQGS